MSNFIEYVGNASTTAWLNGKRLGHNVSVAAYKDKDGIKLTLETNGSRVIGVKNIIMSTEKYDEFCNSNESRLFIAAIELFGAKTAWSKDDDEDYDI